VEVAINAANVSVYGCESCIFHTELLFFYAVDCLGYRSSNFIVGLTNTHPSDRAPVLWQYTLCGQYPGTVPNGATVTVQCTNAYNHGLRFRFVIVQFPLINDAMNFCEIEVFTVGKNIVIGTTIVYQLRSNIKNHKMRNKKKIIKLILHVGVAV